MKHKITIDQFTSVSDFVDALVAGGIIAFSDPVVEFYGSGDPLDIGADTKISFEGFAISDDHVIVIQRANQSFSDDYYVYAFWAENTEDAQTDRYQRFMAFIAENYCNNSYTDARAFFTALSNGYVFMDAANSLIESIPGQEVTEGSDMENTDKAVETMAMEVMYFAAKVAVLFGLCTLVVISVV
ncbi:hypothetical protein HAP94_18680 [Acidithiobacillus ferrivorans]|nr:hypothetical protein [Acidithiobacillus ferrivorans]